MTNLGEGNFPYLPGYALQYFFTEKAEPPNWVNAISAGVDCNGFVSRSASYPDNPYIWIDNNGNRYLFPADNTQINENIIMGFIRGEELIFLIRIKYPNFENLMYFKDIFYHSNILLINDENNKLWSIPNPGLDDSVNRANLLDEEATLELFNSEILMD